MNKKVYLVAYSCEPNQGGEHEVGWKVANELVNKCNLTVITRKSNQKLNEKYNSRNINFIYLENSFFINYKPSGKFSYIYYFFWQVSVFLHLRKVVREKDIVHYITFGNIHLPHLLFLLKSKLILGPMGGGSIVDIKLIRNPNFKTRAKSLIYQFINWTVKINPIYYLLLFRSEKIILRTEETKKVIPKLFHNKCIIFLETGVDISNIHIESKHRKLETIISVSKIIDSKNIDQVIEVFIQLVQLTKKPLSLTIVGDGPLKKEFEEKYSFVSNLKFLGNIPHEEVELLLQDADLFIFCSIKEGGSHSLFEAAMNNCPIACYDISGMKIFPAKNTAIKIMPSKNIEENIACLSQEIYQTFNKSEVDQVCQMAVKDIKNNYDWEQIGDRYMDIYNLEARKIK